MAIMNHTKALIPKNVFALFSRLANRIIASAPNMGGNRKGEGSVLGMVGDMIDGR